MSKWLAFAIVFSAEFGLAQSQSPVPTPSKSSKIQQQVRADKQGDTKSDDKPPEHIAPSVNQGQSQSGYGEHGHQTNQGDHGSALSNTLVAIFTGVLALLAVFQFWAMHRQADYMRRGLRISIRQTRTARTAAQAANRSAEALQKIERAFVFPAKWKIDEIHIGASPEISCSMVNSGNTPATVRKTDITCWLLDKDGVPPDPVYTDSVGVAQVVIPPKSDINLRFGSKRITYEEWDALKRGEAVLHLRGFVEYEDVFKEIRRSDFGAYYDFVKDRWVYPVGNNYNYYT